MFNEFTSLFVTINCSYILLVQKCIIRPYILKGLNGILVRRLSLSSHPLFASLLLIKTLLFSIVPIIFNVYWEDFLYFICMYLKIALNILQRDLKLILYEMWSIITIHVVIVIYTHNYAHNLPKTTCGRYSNWTKIVKKKINTQKIVSLNIKCRN